MEAKNVKWLKINPLYFYFIKCFHAIYGNVL